MNKTALFVLFLFLTLTAHGQTRNLAFFAGADYQPILAGSRLGFEMNGRYFLQENISAGMEIKFTSKKYNEGLGFETDRTAINYSTINLFLQFDVVKREKWILAAFLANGVNFIQLNDLNDIRLEEHSYEENGIWFSRTEEKPKRLNRDAFYVMAPGVDLSLKLATFKAEDNLKLYLTSRVSYQVPFGKGDFIDSGHLKNVIFSLGFTLKGRL